MAFSVVTSFHACGADAISRSGRGWHICNRRRLKNKTKHTEWLQRENWDFNEDIPAASVQGEGNCVHYRYERVSVRNVFCLCRAMTQMAESMSCVRGA